MKLFLKSFIYLFAVNAYAQSQIPDNYYEDFDNIIEPFVFLCDYDNNYWKEQVWNDTSAYVCQQPVDTYNDRVTLASGRICGGKSLNLRVKPGDHANMNMKENETRTRSEITLSPTTTNHVQDDEYYYAWSFFIPNNEEFVDFLPHDTIQSSHIIAQWHTWGKNKDYPFNKEQPFSLSYLHDTTATNEVREIVFKYQRTINENYEGTGRFNKDNGQEITAFKNTNNRTSIRVPIKKGEWNDVILHIKWSIDTIRSPNTGFMEIWVNGEHILNPETQNEVGHPYRMYGPNLKKHGGIIRPNYFKAGHYRAFNETTHNLRFDDFRIGKTLEEVNLRTTIKPEYINEVVGSTIECHKINGIDNYDFYFVNEGVVLENQSNIFDLTLPFFIQPKKEYRVKVRPAMCNPSDKVTLFSDEITFTTPHLTQVRSEYCNNLAGVEEIACYEIPGIDHYKFRFTLPDGSFEWVNSTEPEITLMNRHWASYNTTYNVIVRGMINQTDGYAYGLACEVTTPPVPYSAFPDANDEIINNSAVSDIRITNALDQLEIRSLSHNLNTQMVIYSISGIKVYEQSFYGQHTFEKGSLADGLYIAKINNGERLVTFKFVK